MVRSAVGRLKLLERSGEFIFPVELWMYNDAVSRNNWQFINLERHRALWAGVPILVAYTNDGNQIGDGHNQEAGTDPKTGEPVSSFTAEDAERIVGAISEKESDIRLEREDGVTWVVARGFLWAWYARELVEKIARDAAQGRAMSVSIEAMVTKARMETVRPEGGGELTVEVEEAYKPLGVTILGDHVEPAYTDAHIAMLSRIGGEFQALKLRAAAYLGNAELRMQNAELADASTHAKNNTGSQSGKGVGYRMNRAQERELAKKFPDYRVIGASEDSRKVVLMAKNGTDVSGYEFQDSDKGTVIAERMAMTELRGCASVGGEDVSVDVARVIESCDTRLAALAEENEALKGENEKLSQRVRDMEARETARRIAASRQAALDRVKEANEDREESRRFSESDVADVIRRAEAGEFVSCEDAEGAWRGEAEARNAAAALMMAKQAEFDRQDREARVREASRKDSQYIWEKLKLGEADDGSIEALLARKGIRN